jgi:leader peptidase (prepilin peptidase)/N-methyltransferase
VTGSPEADLALLVGACGFLGLFIGSFLNVVIHRVPLGESVVHPRSRCPGCGAEIAWYDNIPVLSWLLLRGRCRGCGEPISARYPLVELLTGVLFAATAWWTGADWELPAFLYLAAIAVALSAIDLDTKRLPDRIVLPSYVVGAVLLALPALLDARGDDYVRALLAALALFAFYFLLAFIYPAGMGFGDVKFAGVLGLYLGWVSWAAVIVGTFAAFVLGAVVGIAVLVLGRGGRKTKVPFGPFMVIGAYLGLVVGSPLATWYAGLLGL